MPEKLKSIHRYDILKPLIRKPNSILSKYVEKGSYSPSENAPGLIGLISAQLIINFFTKNHENIESNA